MSNVHYDLFCLADIPGLTLLDRQLLGHMCTRYNENANPPKAYPGADELRRITGAEPESNSRAIGRLVDKTFLFRVTRPSKGGGGNRGNRSEVAPNLKLIASYVHITDGLSKKNPKLLALYNKLTSEPVIDNPADSINNSRDVISNPADAITYPTGYAKPIEPIEPIYKRIEPKNVYKINYERWNVITSELPENVKNLIKPGRNSETSLDRCETNGMRLTEIRKAVGAINYTNAYKVGGLLNDVLEGLAGVTRVSKSKSGLDHCGDRYCDPVTRTFPEPSEINGRLDNRCPNCNEQLINETKRRNDPPPFDFADFGRIPDDV